MYIVKSVGVLSVAKILGLMYACLGLIFAPMFLLIGVLASAAGQQNSPLAGSSALALPFSFQCSMA